MADAARNYSMGTRMGLFALSQGTCYFPECDKPLVEFVGDVPEIVVEIAHIRGAKSGSERYDPNMTDPERAAFSNLILLCKKHHLTVDKRRPKDFSVEILEGWKRDREPTADLHALRVTEPDLLDAIREAVAELAPTRDVRVQLGASFLTPQGNYGGDFETAAQIWKHNPHFRHFPLLLAVTLRNVGRLAVSLAEVNVHFQMSMNAEPATLSDFVLMGRNDIASLNPPLPHRMPDGDAVNWMLSNQTIAEVADRVGRVDTHTVVGMFAQARLATGEAVDSNVVPWYQVAAAGFPVEGTALED